MGNQQVLLQMLMPMVRPDGIAPSNSTQNLPLEQQSFEQMLIDLQAMDSTQAQVTAQDPDPAPSQMMQQLGGIDRIDNSALRDMLAQRQNQNDDVSQS